MADDSRPPGRRPGSSGRPPVVPDIASVVYSCPRSDPRHFRRASQSFRTPLDPRARGPRAKGGEDDYCNDVAMLPDSYKVTKPVHAIFGQLMLVRPCAHMNKLSRSNKWWGLLAPLARKGP